MLSHEFCFLGKAGILNLHEKWKTRHSTLHVVLSEQRYCHMTSVFWAFHLKPGSLWGGWPVDQKILHRIKTLLQTLSTNVKSSGSPPPSFSISAKLPNLRSPPWICPTSQRYHSQTCIYVIFIYSLQKQHMYSILVSYHLFECCVVFYFHLEYHIMILILRKINFVPYGAPAYIWAYTGQSELVPQSYR